MHELCRRYYRAPDLALEGWHMLSISRHYELPLSLQGTVLLLGSAPVGK